MSQTSLLATARAASVAELVWRADGGLRATGTLPLVGPHGMVLALPYADAALARAIAASDEVLLTLTEPRGCGAEWSAVAVRARPRLVEDLTGARFRQDLLAQELLRWPPSRLLADSMLLRRENWWWLPRLLVELDVVEPPGASSVIAREAPEDHVLVVDTGDGLRAVVVRVGADPNDLRPRGPAPAPGRAVLIGQDLSFPDLERWAAWSWSGWWDGVALDVRRAPTARGLPAVSGVWARWRRHRALERACREGIRAATPR